MLPPPSCSPSPLFLFLVCTEQHSPSTAVICPALTGSPVAWAAVCFAGPVHPKVAFLLTGITSVRGALLKSREKMLPWAMTLPSHKRKYSPFLLLGQGMCPLGSTLWGGCSQNRKEEAGGALPCPYQEPLCFEKSSPRPLGVPAALIHEGRGFPSGPFPSLLPLASHSLN